MGAESVTGGVRDTLAAALYDKNPAALDADEADLLADSVLAALSSPEVVRVATEALTEHHGTVETGRHAISGLPYRYVRCCGIPRPKENHAAHQWSVLVAALRGER